MNRSRIIIGDVHGCFDTLMVLMAKLPKDIPVTFAGDLIDRGPDSNKVVEFVKNGRYDCVLGNHEVMMTNELQFQIDKDGKERAYTDLYHGIWEMNGGDKCIKSYKGNVKLLKEHLEWFKTLPYYIEYKDIKNDKGDHLLVTHTTAAEVWYKLNHDSPQFKDEVVWNRTPFPPKIKGIYNIYGHTPQQYKATVKDHFSCIDTGCYLKRRPYGKLTALQFPEMILFEQENVE